MVAPVCVETSGGTVGMALSSGFSQLAVSFCVRSVSWPKDVSSALIRLVNFFSFGTDGEHLALEVLVLPFSVIGQVSGGLVSLTLGKIMNKRRVSSLISSISSPQAWSPPHKDAMSLSIQLADGCRSASMPLLAATCCKSFPVVGRCLKGKGQSCARAVAKCLKGAPERNKPDKRSEAEVAASATTL